MALTGQQIKQLRQALLDAFPSKALLEMMVRIELNEQLDAIAYGDNQTVIVYKLIAWAERTDNVRALIAGAAAENGRNPLVAKLVNDSRSWVFDIPVVQAAPEAPPPPIAFDWVTIPAGEFLMGSDKTKDKLAYDDETPQHTLYLPEYRIARVPVTVAQFAAFMAANQGYRTTTEVQGSAYSWTGSEWDDIEGADWAHPRGPQSDVQAKQEHPVTCVSWHDALAFCAWAGVRLPTEAEWEKAARGLSTGSGDGRIWPWGNREPNSGVCNFNMTVGDTTPVGHYPDGKSPYGLLDAAGNVWEWTGSLWGQDASKPEFGYPYDAKDGRENPSAPNTVRRVLRGGSFGDDAQGVRCACRVRSHPDHRLGIDGFRVVSFGF